MLLLPTINGNRATCIHSKANCINASTEHADLAWEWVKAPAGDAANEALGKTGAAIPAHTAYSHLFFEQYPQCNMAIFSQEAEECAYPYPTSKSFNEWADVVWNELVPVYMLIISTFQAFDGIYLMIGTKSAATKYAQSMVMYFYRIAFDYSNKGYASAVAVKNNGSASVM